MKFEKTVSCCCPQTAEGQKAGKYQILDENMSKYAHNQKRRDEGAMEWWAEGSRVSIEKTFRSSLTRVTKEAFRVSPNEFWTLNAGSVDTNAVLKKKKMWMKAQWGMGLMLW